MISIITCSKDPERQERFREDIAKNIGIDFEIIAFDNRTKNWGLCRVYNFCSEQARFPYLCFMHEDVYVDTKDWGEKIVEATRELPNCGVIGFAGGSHVGRNFTSWWAGALQVNVYDGYNGKNHADLRANFQYHNYSNPRNEDYSRVLCVDGLFQMVKKEVWEEIRYDDHSFSGFHMYDVDFSLSVSEKYNNYVGLKYEVYHDSHGNLTSDYIRDLFVFQNKWKHKLPRYVMPLRKKEAIQLELSEIDTLKNLCRRNHMSKAKILLQLYRQNSLFMLILALIHLSFTRIKIILWRNQ
ncbi:MAG: glycosyltransferase [Bacteroidales bacterium]